MIITVTLSRIYCYHICSSDSNFYINWSLSCLIVSDRYCFYEAVSLKVCKGGGGGVFVDDERPCSTARGKYNRWRASCRGNPIGGKRRRGDRGP